MGAEGWPAYSAYCGFGTIGWPGTAVMTTTPPCRCGGWMQQQAMPQQQTKIRTSGIAQTRREPMTMAAMMPPERPATEALMLASDDVQLNV